VFPVRYELDLYILFVSRMILTNDSNISEFDLRVGGN
jgi:hypothetical protein